MLNVPHGMGYPARMPVVPNRNEFFALQKTRSQKCTRMYIFDEVVAVGFNTLCYDVACEIILRMNQHTSPQSSEVLNSSHESVCFVLNSTVPCAHFT